MIRHIVFFTLADRDNRDAVLAGLSLLTEIPKDIPGARLVEIGTNERVDHWDNAVEIVVYGEFDDEAALAAYKAHPNYEKSTGIVKPLRQLRFAADYDSAGAVRQRL